MQSNSVIRLSGQVVVGFLVAFLGVVFLLDNLAVIDAGQILRYWPALAVLFGVARAVECRASQTKYFWLAVAFIFALMLLDRMRVLTFHLHDWWPLVLILIGGSMLMKSVRRHSTTFRMEPESTTESDSVLNLFALMGGFKTRNESTEFRGGHVTAVMGGCDIDLRKASIAGEEATLDVFAFWGGISLKVPENWLVIVKSIPIMGGVEDKTAGPSQGATKRLVISGYTVMGGVEVKN